MVSFKLQCQQVSRHSSLTHTTQSTPHTIPQSPRMLDITILPCNVNYLSWTSLGCLHDVPLIFDFVVVQFVPFFCAADWIPWEESSGSLIVWGCLETSTSALGESLSPMGRGRLKVGCRHKQKLTAILSFIIMRQIDDGHSQQKG